jgi:spoIIIJ-associated protein
MKAFLDFEEKSVEEAVQKACNKLNISEDRLKYDVISHGSSGIFGLVGTKKALIRVFLPEPAKEEKMPVGAEGTGQDETGGELERSNRETVTALVDEAFGKAETDDKTEPEAVKDNENAIAVARGLIEKIIETLSVDAEVTVQQADNQSTINIKGADAGIIIGKRGQTLEAIQYLVDKVVNKQCGKGIRIIIDIEGYIETRKSELKEIASSLAEKTLQTGKPSTMNRMNAHDRRVVHVALKNNRSVRTQSVGGGYYRKLIIFPKKKSRQKQTKEES